MTRPTPRNWWIFGICALMLAMAMVWVTSAMLRLDDEKRQANAETAHHIALSTALWRMDSWLAPQLAGEATRPHFEYQAYYPQSNAYTKMLGEIKAGEVVTPSELLSYRSPIFQLHFQVDDEGTLTSPQVPTGNWRDLTQGNMSTLDLDGKAQLLERLRQRATASNLLIATCYMAAANTAPPPQPVPQSPLSFDYASRARATDQAKNSVQQLAASPNTLNPPHAPPATGGIPVGSLEPAWIDSADKAVDDHWLVFVREVKSHGKKRLQGFLTDWPKLRACLLEQITDLFPTATPTLVRHQADATECSGQMMARLPAKLSVAMVAPEGPITSPTKAILMVAWGGLLLTLLAVGFALHSTNRFGERRARFASAVTHELRTPLTTFRMYSEMLADGMVSDPAQRTEYLNTLTSEADRLSRLVENVLSYARLEEGRYNTHPESITLAELLARIRPVLMHRTDQAGGELQIHVPTDATVLVDVDAVTQILFNLVDNACKYGLTTAGDPVIVDVRPAADHVDITVRDRGPGIPSEVQRRVFQAFERGARQAGDNETPGVGLGLALALALGKDLGGSLRLDPGTPGASFTLAIPRPTFG